MRWCLRSKIEKATVTQANPEQAGGIIIDAALINKAGFWPGEKVLVVNDASDVRLQAYVLAGPKGSGVISINSPAGQAIVAGDKITIMGFELSTEPLTPTAIQVDDHNHFLRYL
jgi:aspartate 1-decarboxylase